MRVAKREEWERRGMGERPKRTGAIKDGDLEASGLHEENLGCATQVRNAVRKEGGVVTTHHALGSRKIVRPH